MNAWWGRLIVATVLFVVSFTAVNETKRSQGVVRDEVIYMESGRRYAEWWSKFWKFDDGVVTENSINRTFGGALPGPNNPEHPPLMKTMFGFYQRWFGAGKTPTDAYRTPSVIMNALLVVMVFLFAGRVFGYREGVVAAALTLLLPRAFFHAGLAAFDAPVVTFWFATLYAYYKTLQNRWWLFGLGVAFGFALATKHNAILLPIALIVHCMWVETRADAVRTKAAGAVAWLASLGRGILTLRPSVFIPILVMGPAVLIALWPWLWFDSAEHIRTWLDFHFAHNHYNFEYLGDNWNHPPFPWHVVIVTTLFTVPVVTLLGAAIGAVALIVRARRGEAAAAERAPAFLLFLSASVAMGPFLLGSTPIFGAEKHWAPAIPTICIFAGIGIVAAAGLLVDRLVAMGLFSAARRAVANHAVFAVLAVSAVGAAAAETVDAQPYALSHYNALAGGAPGGADLGMNRQFWGYSARGVLPFLHQRLEQAGGQRLAVYSHDASPAWISAYPRDGLLDPRELGNTSLEEPGVKASKLALVIHEKHFNRHDYMIWRVYGTVQPVFVLTTDGVPIVTVYQRPAKPSPTPSKPGSDRR